MRSIEVYGRADCAETQKTRKHLEALGADYEYIDIGADRGALERVQEWNAGEATTPTVRLHGNSASPDQERVLSAPGNTALDAALDQLGILPLSRDGDGSSGIDD